MEGRSFFLSLALLVAAFSLSGTGADHPCPSGWFSFDHLCYKLIKQRKTWADAEMSCGQLQNGSHLASIQSGAESAYVARLVSKYVPPNGVWIGLNDPENNRLWKWSDGSQFGYTSWARREPNNVDDKEFCVELSKWSRYRAWRAIKCEFKRFFICKWQPPSV